MPPCLAGRALRHHRKNSIGDERNLVLFIGYCAEHTLGSQIVRGQNPVNIFGEPHEVTARIDAFSGHAEKNELRGYVERLTGDIKKISVIHGEEEQCLIWAETLRKMKPQAEVIVPQHEQVLEV